MWVPMGGRGGGLGASFGDRPSRGLSRVRGRTVHRGSGGGGGLRALVALRGGVGGVKGKHTRLRACLLPRTRLRRCPPPPVPFGVALRGITGPHPPNEARVQGRRGGGALCVPPQTQWPPLGVGEGGHAPPRGCVRFRSSSRCTLL